MDTNNIIIIVGILRKIACLGRQRVRASPYAIAHFFWMKKLPRGRNCSWEDGLSGQAAGHCPSQYGESSLRLPGRDNTSG
jgi:hypothetical protein